MRFLGRHVDEIVSGLFRFLAEKSHSIGVTVSTIVLLKVAPTRALVRLELAQLGNRVPEVSDGTTVTTRVESDRVISSDIGRHGVVHVVDVHLDLVLDHFAA